MIKLIASDMDGTLLNEHGKLSEEFFHIFEILKEKKIKFVAASGRQYYNLVHQFSKVKEDIIYAAENGTFLVHKHEELSSTTLDKAVIDELIQISRRIEGAYIVLCGKKAAYVEDRHEKFIKEVEKYYTRYEIVNSLDDVEDEFLKFTLCDLSGAAQNSSKVIMPIYEDSLQVTVSGELWLDIVNNNINKGVAIQLLQEKYNISPEETMVFGDYFNDIEMLKSAYHSYAMENSPEEVKKHARFIAKSNSQNGVLEVIKSKIL